MKKCKDDRYRRKVVVGYDSDNKPITKWATGKTQSIVEKRIVALKTQYCTPASDLDYEKIFGEYAVEWFDLYKRDHVKPTTLASYKSALNVHILPIWGTRRIITIKPKELQKWLNGYKGARGGTVDNILLVTRQIFRRAMVDGTIEKDPTYALVRPKTNVISREAVPQNQIAILIHVGLTHSEGLLILILYFAGLRRGEALGLLWEDIDFNIGVIHVHREIVYVSGHIIVYEAEKEGLKSTAAARDVIICTMLLDQLKAQRGFGYMPVFFGPVTGSWLSFSTYRRRWNRLMKAAGLENERNNRA